MSTNPLISIITVVYNGEKHLESTIKSVIEQSYNHFEYIIIDGNSEDRTVEIIKKYEHNITHWISESDNGIYEAINKGLNLSKGDFVGIINSDDFYEPDALQNVVNEININRDIDIFFGDIYILNPHLKSKKLLTYKKGKNLEKSFSIWHPSVFVRKSTYETYGYFDLSYRLAADYELLLRFQKKKCTFCYINKALSNFREGGISYYNKNLIFEQYQLQKLHTNSAFSTIIFIKNYTVFLLQKLGMKLLGEREYHTFRYKYLYK
jgi:glycosyltransferase involved in cell wall biosynthesis